jgi:hypothetical protein
MSAFVSFIEEAVLNPEFSGYVGGRVEVYRDVDKYAVEEIRFFTKDPEFSGFRNQWDFRRITDKQLIFIRNEIALRFHDTAALSR